MRTPSDDPLVSATARLLHADPTLTNLELLRKLASHLGEEVVRKIPANRFQRKVRDPALRLLRNGLRNGADDRTAGVRHPVSTEESPTASSPVDPTGREPDPPAQILHEALLEAFVLGSSWESRREAVAALRRLTAVERRVERRLAGEG